MTTSNPGHNGGQYDQSLLAEAPKTTKQMRQEGYNPDILEDPSERNNSVLNRDLESGLGASKERLATVGAGTSPTPRSPPFYRTRKGAAIIILVALVVIGAVVGGAVGGTRNRHHKVEATGTPGVAGGGSSTGKTGDGNSGSGVSGGGPQAAPQGGPPGGTGPSSSSVTNPLGVISSVLESQSSSSTTTTSIHGRPSDVNGVASIPDSIVKVIG